MDRGFGLQPFLRGQGSRDGGIFFEHAHRGGGLHPLLWTIFALVLVLLLVAIVSLALDAYHRSQRPRAVAADAPPGGALAVLDARYAAGEVSRRDYLLARKDILGTDAPAP